MSWVLVQRTGNLYSPSGEVVTVAYSGHSEGKNNPELESVPNVGPIPRGLWAMSAPRSTLTHGPFVIPLTPLPGTDTHGRSGFMCHGDSVSTPGSASLGCLILPKPYRVRLWKSGDPLLRVVAEEIDVVK